MQAAREGIHYLDARDRAGAFIHYHKIISDRPARYCRCYPVINRYYQVGRGHLRGGDQGRGAGGSEGGRLDESWRGGWNVSWVRVDIVSQSIAIGILVERVKPFLYFVAVCQAVAIAVLDQRVGLILIDFIAIV